VQPNHPVQRTGDASLGAGPACDRGSAWPDAGLVAIMKILLTFVVVDLLREIPSWAAAQAFANPENDTMHDIATLNAADALGARLHLDRATILKMAREVGRQRRIAVAEALDSLSRCRSCGDDSAGLDSPALTTAAVACGGDSRSERANRRGR
jgi:hypothetical protein